MMCVVIAKNEITIGRSESMKNKKCKFINECPTNKLCEDCCFNAKEAVLYTELLMKDDVEKIKNPQNWSVLKQREFESGAVRDNAEGKGRFDLMPFGEMSMWFEGKNPAVYDILAYLDEFKRTGESELLNNAIMCFYYHSVSSVYEFTLDLAKHFENGAKHYGADNWKKGIPLSCYIDSGVRHLMKFYAGYADERHDVAFVWNMLCAEWTCDNMPEMNDYSERVNI